MGLPAPLEQPGQSRQESPRPLMLLTQPRPCWQKHVRVRVVAARAQVELWMIALGRLTSNGQFCLLRQSMGISSHMAVPAAARRSIACPPTPMGGCELKPDLHACHPPQAYSSTAIPLPSSQALHLESEKTSFHLPWNTPLSSGPVRLNRSTDSTSARPRLPYRCGYPSSLPPPPAGGSHRTEPSMLASRTLSTQRVVCLLKKRSAVTGSCFPRPLVVSQGSACVWDRGVGISWRDGLFQDGPAMAAAGDAAAGVSDGWSLLWPDLPATARSDG